jgi:peptide/nickel transport system substrate-binding protein
VVDQHVKLQRNDNYWRAADAKVAFPHAGDLAYITIKTNEEVNSRILNIKANQTHGAYWPTNHANEVWNGVTGADGDGTLKSSVDNLKVFCGNPGFNVMFLGFNMNPYLNKSGVTTQSPFVNKSVREAFSYAFDYDTFIDSVVNGFGQQLQGPVPVGMFGHDDDLYMYDFNLTKAAEYWNEAMADGWLDGVLDNNSNDLTIYYNSGNTVREAACLLLKDGVEEMLDNATYGAIAPATDLTITIQPLEWSSYLFQVRNKQLPIFFLGWAPDYADPDNYVGPFVKSTGTYPNRIGLGISDGWDAAEVDGWISDAAQSSSASEREDLYEDIQEAIVDHCAYLWCYQATSFQVRHISVNGYVFNPMHSDYFYHMWLDE